MFVKQPFCGKLVVWSWFYLQTLKGKLLKIKYFTVHDLQEPGFSLILRKYLDSDPTFGNFFSRARCKNLESKTMLFVLLNLGFLSDCKNCQNLSRSKHVTCDFEGFETFFIFYLQLSKSTVRTLRMRNYMESTRAWK